MGMKGGCEGQELREISKAFWEGVLWERHGVVGVTQGLGRKSVNCGNKEGLYEIKENLGKGTAGEMEHQGTDGNSGRIENYRRRRQVRDKKLGEQRMWEKQLQGR